jgi:hypothetical protein
MMDAQIGNFKVHVKKSGLHLRHSMGVGFEMTRGEVLGFLQLLQAYQHIWLEQPDSADADPQTQPIVRFLKPEDDQPDSPS